MAKMGRKPFGEKAKIPYHTKLPVDQVAFLRTLGNAAAWLSGAIEERRREEYDAIYGPVADRASGG